MRLPTLQHPLQEITKLIANKLRIFQPLQIACQQQHSWQIFRIHACHRSRGKLCYPRCHMKSKFLHFQVIGRLSSLVVATQDLLSLFRLFGFESTGVVSNPLRVLLAISTTWASGKAHFDGHICTGKTMTSAQKEWQSTPIIQTIVQKWWDLELSHGNSWFSENVFPSILMSCKTLGITTS